MKSLITYILLSSSIIAFAQEKNRPQTPTEPYPYLSESFQFENEEAEILLHGTLTIPQGEGPFPAAILISGSGPTDRDETIFDHKIFLVLADYLTRQGIAVLRYDDRGVGESKGNHYNATSMDLANDTQSAFSALAKHGKVDSSHIGLIGHSEGGMIAPIVASKISTVDYAVLLAGPGAPIDELMIEQNRQVYKSLGLPKDELDRNEVFNKSLYNLFDNDRPVAELYDTLLPFIHSYYESIPKEYQALFSPSKEVFYMAIVGAISSPWFRYFLQFDPVPYLKKTECPVLAINGSKDIQVISTQNLPGIVATLSHAGNLDITIREYKDLNHLFQKCTTCTVQEYEELEETFSIEVLQDVAKWILEKTK